MKSCRERKEKEHETERRNFFANHFNVYVCIINENILLSHRTATDQLEFLCTI